MKTEKKKGKAEAQTRHKKMIGCTDNLVGILCEVEKLLSCREGHKNILHETVPII
jgi:hypothetical protein